MRGDVHGFLFFSKNHPLYAEKPLGLIKIITAGLFDEIRYIYESYL